MLEPIDTGQKFPPGTETAAGTCLQCQARRPLAAIRVSLPGVPRQELDVCAECFADILIGAQMTNGAVELKAGGQYRHIAGDLGIAGRES